jgi:hypothetical protein
MKEPRIFDMLQEIRSMRKELLERIIKEYEGEVCVCQTLQPVWESDGVWNKTSIDGKREESRNVQEIL